jgi:hypothetical protein
MEIKGVINKVTGTFKSDEIEYEIIARGVCEETGREVILLASPAESFGGSVKTDGDLITITLDIKPIEWGFLNRMMLSGFDDFYEQEQAIFNLK